MPLREIRDKVDLLALMNGLAEEAVELAKAALKYRRALTQESPTPVSDTDAYRNLLEEIADVNVYVKVLGLTSTTVNDMEIKKINRWLERLKERENG